MTSILWINIGRICTFSTTHYNNPLLWLLVIVFFHKLEGNINNFTYTKRQCLHPTSTVYCINPENISL